jgi:hypothetical protein
MIQKRAESSNSSAEIDHSTATPEIIERADVINKLLSQDLLDFQPSSYPDYPTQTFTPAPSTGLIKHLIGNVFNFLRGNFMLMRMLFRKLFPLSS